MALLVAAWHAHSSTLNRHAYLHCRATFTDVSEVRRLLRGLFFFFCRVHNSRQGPIRKWCRGRTVFQDNRRRPVINVVSSYYTRQPSASKASASSILLHKLLASEPEGEQDSAQSSEATCPPIARLQVPLLYPLDGLQSWGRKYSQRLIRQWGWDLRWN